MIQSLNPCPENFDHIMVSLDWVGGGGGNYQMQIVQTYQLSTHFSGLGVGWGETTKGKWSKLTNYQQHKWSKLTNYQLISGGGGNYQMQMVQTNQLPTHFWGGGGGKLPNANGPNLPTTNSFPGGSLFFLGGDDIESGRPSFSRPP